MGTSWGVFLGSCLVFGVAVQGQTTQGVISGLVVDSQSGQPVADAKVRCVHLSSETAYENSTGRDGRFVFPLLSPGTYRIRVESGDRYQAQLLDNLELAVSENLALHFRLRPRQDVWEQFQHQSVFRPNRSVLVFFGPDLDTSRTGSFEGNNGRKFGLETSVSNVIDPAEVRDLPLTGRDVYTMLVTEPGVAASTAIGRGLGVSANGQRPSSSNFMLDGLQNNNFLTTGPLSAVAPEAIQEYRLSINNFSAEYGGTSGFLANAVTRGGTPEWHGLAYVYVKRHTLNANDFQRNTRGESRLPAKELQPGFQAGGPVWRKLVFGSVAFEALRFRGESEARTYVVPTSLFVPKAGSVAERLLKQYAPPAVANPAGSTASLSLGPRTSIDRFLALPRADLDFSARHRIFTRVAVNRFERPDLAWSPYTAFNVPLVQNTLGIAAGWTATLSSRLTSELRLGRGSQLLSIQRPNGNVPFLVTLERGVNLPGSAFSYDLHNRDRNWEFIENLVWTHGAHTVKFGGQVLARSLDGFLDFQPSGLYRFQNMDAFGADAIRSVAFSAARQIPSLDGSASESPALPDTLRQYTYRQFAWFAQDAWRVSSRLAANYGLRYENFGVPSSGGSAKDLLIEPGPGSSEPERLRTATPALQSRLYTAHGGNWSARAGFSYALRESRRTLLRGAYGTFYDRPFDNYWQPLRVNSLVNAESAVVDPTDYLQPLAQVVRNFHDVTFFSQSPRLTIYQPEIADGRAHNYFLGLQHEVTGGLVVEAATLGSRGSRLITTDLVNRAFTLDRAAPGNPFRVINPMLPPDLFQRASNGRSRYDAFSLTTRYRTGRGQVHAAYTLSRTFDNQSDPLAGDFFNLGFSRTGLPAAILPLPAFTAQFNPGSDWGHADFDQRHNLAIYSLWELPGVARGWRVSQMAAFRSGLPFSVIARSRDGALISPRADLGLPAADAFRRSPYAGGVRLMQPDAFRLPASGTYGNTARNAFEGPGFWSLDFSLGREFSPRAWGEGRRVIFRADALNVLNHANLNNPETFLQANSAAAPFGVGLFGRRDRGSGFPTLVPFDEAGRQIQLMLRVVF